MKTAEEIFAEIDAKHQRLAEEMPTAADCFRVIQEATERLRELGWSEASYCPKDGSSFQMYEAGMGASGVGHYQGEWPTGGWWMHDKGGDLWPSRPMLWKPLEES